MLTQRKNIIRNFYRQNEISLDHNDFNSYILYHSIYCLFSSIMTYDLMMAQWR